MIDEVAIGERYRALAGDLDERQRRRWAAAEARSHGRGGIAAVARASGIAENTIRAGLRELASGESIGTGRVRKAGGGRKPITQTDPSLVKDLERLVDADSRGDPEQPLRWTAKSVRKLADGLRELGHEVSHQTVARLLRSRGYSLQANAKTREGSSHPDRDAQFAHINQTASAAITAGQPVISVDTKRRSWSETSRTVAGSCGFQLHLAELARQTARQPRGHRQPDRRDHHAHRPRSLARLDEGSYPKSIVVSDAELAAVNLTGHEFHPEWNYTINLRIDS